MAKKTKDSAVEYLQSLGITIPKSAQEITDCLQNLGEIAESRADNEMKYGPYAVAAAMDGDLLRKICNWIAYHKNKFGAEILEIGTGAGIIACYIAKEMPGSKVTAIDVSEKALQDAHKLADSLNLNNIEIRNGSFYELENMSFDTIILNRVLMDYIDIGYVDEMLLLNAQADSYKRRFDHIFGEIETHLTKNGTFVCFEDMNKDVCYLGMLYGLREHGLMPELRYLKELNYQGVEKDKKVLQVITAVQNGDVSREQLFAFFADQYKELFRHNTWFLSDLPAATYLQSTMGELIEGYTCYFPSGGKATKIALWQSRTEPGWFLCEQHVSDGAHKLTRCPDKDLESETAGIHQDINGFLKKGMRIKVLHYQDGVEMETDLPPKS